MAIFFAFRATTNGAECNEALSVNHDVKVREHYRTALVALPVLRQADFSTVLVGVAAKPKVSSAFRNDAVGAVACEGSYEDKRKKEDDKENY